MRVGQLSGAEERAAKGLLARPTDVTVPIKHAYSVPSEFTCGADMCFHWVETTADAATSNGWPRYRRPGKRFGLRRSTRSSIDRLRFDGATGIRRTAPLADKRKLDVYVLDLGEDGVSGYRAALTGSLTPPVYCAVDNDYAEFGDEPTGSLLEVTSAHEFHHASQAAYDFGEDYWLIEGTATNIEETIYPDIDDNVRYLGLFSPLPASPHRRPRRASGT